MSIRDFVVTALVLGILPYALRHPSAGVLLWTWISIMNPHKLAWGFAYNAPFAAMAAGVTIVALLVTKDKVSLGRDGVVAALIVLILWMVITTVFAFDRSGSMQQLNKVLKIQLMTLIAVAVLHERRLLDAFIWVNVLSLGFYGFKGGLYTIATGGAGRVWGPPGGFIEGNNELALALVMTIPLMYYLRHISTRKWVRHALLLTMLLSVASALGTQSRGALLALSAMGALLWWRGHNKAVTLIPIVVVGIAVFVLMPESWHERMSTIREYEQDGSAMGRINTWGVMLDIAKDRITGGGFAIYATEVFKRYTEHRVLAAHSIYFQMLGEHGWIGLFLFLLLWVMGWRKAGAIRRLARSPQVNDPSLATLAGMCQVSLIGYAVGGAFLSLAYFDLPYNILVILVVAHRLARQACQGAARDAAPVSGAAAGRGRRQSGFPISQGGRAAIVSSQSANNALMRAKKWRMSARSGMG